MSATEIKIKKTSPEVGGEIVLFIVDKRFQGRGIGKTLLNRFLRLCKTKKKIIINKWETYRK